MLANFLQLINLEQKTCTLKVKSKNKIGYLYLNRGQWDGEQIIPKQWIEDSVSSHTPDYGYQWWLRDVKGVFVFSAVGQGGQHIFCVPERDLVVVVASRLSSRYQDRWPLLEELVIPAVFP